MSRVTVVTEYNDPNEGYIRDEYPAVLVDANHAFYIDVEYKTVLLERVRLGSDGLYYSTGGPGSVGFDLPVDDVSFFDRITELSAVELLSALVLREITA